MITDAHSGKAPSNRMAVGGVTVADEVVGRFAPREGLGDLLGDPLGRRMIGDAKGDEPASFVAQDDQNEQQPKANRRHDKKIHCRNACRMIEQEGLPRLRRSGPVSGHVLATVDCAIS